MIAARLHGFGKPSDVLRVEDVPIPKPGDGGVLVKMLAAPVNPADINIIEGKYGDLPELPAIIGNEGVGRIAGVGRGAGNFAPGDLVLPMRRGSWAQYMVTSAAEAFRLPPEMDAHQASMLTVNPPTAWAMLEDFVPLKKGDWVVQNAANSAVGRSVIQIANACGWKTLNIVRRAELIPELTALGADVVVTDDTDFHASGAVEKLCEGARPRLALNAVGGASALNLANAIADGGTVVTYGAMARQPLKIPNGLLIFRDLCFRGFWLNQWRKNTPQEKQNRVMASLVDLCVQKKLHVPVHRVFPLTDAVAAVQEAARERRDGKVLLEH